MLESYADRAVSLSARRVSDRIEIELSRGSHEWCLFATFEEAFGVAKLARARRLRIIKIACPRHSHNPARIGAGLSDRFCEHDAETIVLAREPLIDPIRNELSDAPEIVRVDN